MAGKPCRRSLFLRRHFYIILCGEQAALLQQFNHNKHNLALTNINDKSESLHLGGSLR